MSSELATRTAAVTLPATGLAEPAMERPAVDQTGAPRAVSETPSQPSTRSRAESSTNEPLAPTGAPAAQAAVEPRKSPGDRLRSAWRRAAGSMLDLLLPPRCARCAADLPATGDGALICRPCRGELVRPRPPGCPRCGDHLPAGATSGCCRRCRTAPPPFVAVIHLGAYQGALREAILAIKHAPAEPLAAALIELLWSVRGGELTQLGVDVVAPMPMHWIRRWERGTNAPEVLAERLARRLGAPARPLLARRRHTVPQSSLAPLARLTNLRNAFCVRNAFGRRFGRGCRGAKVLLVDDVLTTGATCSEAAKVLLRGGAASVAVAVLARAEGPV